MPKIIDMMNAPASARVQHAADDPRRVGGGGTTETRMRAPEPPPFHGDRDILTVPQAARWLGMCPDRLRTALREAGLVYERFGLGRVVAGEVLGFLKGAEVSAAGPIPQPRRRRRARKGKSFPAKQKL